MHIAFFTYQTLIQKSSDLEVLIYLISILVLEGQSDILSNLEKNAFLLQKTFKYEYFKFREH